MYSTLHWLHTGDFDSTRDRHGDGMRRGAVRLPAGSGTVLLEVDIEQRSVVRYLNGQNTD